ncbi:hypothetical protein [Streptomyces sp. MMBL 11-1]|uniref:hypothetical protein n=1 Tax=Streptomyces sp. MMBL 11-1 TaxID=3026420 RepID=UPI00235ECE0D|nr:hypothetical protein [Streptomyces sp. MMBL 11-1]
MTIPQAGVPGTTPHQADDGKHGGQPSDRPWTPDPAPEPSPDGSRPQQYVPQP